MNHRSDTSARRAGQRPQRLFPALEWLATYRREILAHDALAATIVTIMLVPQSLAYAMLAGLPPQAGLYASIAPLAAYALFGSSRALAVGPVAVVSLMTAAAAADVAAPGSAAYGAAALSLALLSGFVLWLLAAARLGFVANFLSRPVISGFITASGLLIAASQVKHILGIRAEGFALPELLRSLWQHAAGSHAPTTIIGVATVAFLMWSRRHLKRALSRWGVPAALADMLHKSAPLAAVIGGIAAVSLFELDRRGVKVVGAIPEGWPPLTLPAFDWALWRELLPAAVLISIIGFVESVSVAQTLAAPRRQRIEPDRELAGLGAANVAAALTGGYPVTGGFARSVVNYDAGAQTPMAGVFTAGGIALVSLFFTPLLQKLPQATLAATIIVAVLSLVDLEALKRAYAYSRGDFAAMMATIVVVLLWGVEAGVVAGVGLSIAIFLWRTSRPHIAIVGQVPGTEHFRNVKRHAVVASARVLTVRVDESLYFANARLLEDEIQREVAARPELEHVVLLCSAVNFIDMSALESLEAIVERLDAAGIAFHLSEVKGPVLDRLQRSRLLARLTGRVFLSQYAAMQALDAETTRIAASSGAAGSNRSRPGRGA